MRETPEQTADRMFKDHVATYEKHGPIEYLLWAQPKSSNCMIRYYMHDSTLMINGDLGEAVLSWSWSPDCTLEWVSKCDFGYYIGKLRASAYGREGKVWRSECAKRRLDEFFADHPEIENHKDDYDSPYACIETEHDWYKFIDSSKSIEIFGDDYTEYGGIGMERDFTLRMHFIGLQRAMKRLELGEASDHVEFLKSLREIREKSQ